MLLVIVKSSVKSPDVPDVVKLTATGRAFADPAPMPNKTAKIAKILPKLLITLPQKNQSFRPMSCKNRASFCKSLNLLDTGKRGAGLFCQKCKDS